MTMEVDREIVIADPQVQHNLALPQEVMDYIIDFHHGSLQDLKALALVSNACLPSARRHLFSTLTVFDHQQGRQGLEGFQLVLEAGPTVTAAVRNLHFFAVRSPDAMGHVPLSTIVAAIRRFPQLRTLGLIGVHIQDDCHPQVNSRPRSNPLDLLVIHAPSEKPCSRKSVTTILCQFSSISVLQLEVVLFPVSSEETALVTGTNPSPMVKIFNVTLTSSTTSAELIKDFITVADPDSVDVLIVDHPVISRGLHLSLLKAFASHLSTLTILDCRRIDSSSNDVLSHHDISFCTSLKSLNMTVFDDPTQDSMSKMLAIVPISSTVSTLQITFYYRLNARSDSAHSREKFTHFFRLPVWKDIKTRVFKRLPALSTVNIQISQRFGKEWIIPEQFKSVIQESFVLPAQCSLQFEAHFMRNI